MSDNKISVSLDEVNSTKIDMELNRQDVANRMAEHQEKIKVNWNNTPQIASQNGFFRKAIVYMTIFGFIFSTIAWILGEGIINVRENDNFSQAFNVIMNIANESPNMTDYQLKNELRELKYKIQTLRDNPYLPDKIVDMGIDEFRRLTEEAMARQKILNCLFWVVCGLFIGLGISSAESIVSKNWSIAVKNVILGTILGGGGGFIISLFIDSIYQVLGGGDGNINIQQIFARAVGWGLVGLFVAVAPGILMKSWKKFLLGLTGGFIGGFVGGVLFDPVCMIFGSDAFARFINIIGMGVGAAVAMVFLENIAKQGWLKVAAGLIAGKQFILYRNPTVIGSSPKCEIYLFKDPQVAPKHAAVNNRNGDFMITSIERAPVWVNNIQTLQQRLKTGDQIKIGNTIFIFEAKVLKKK